MTQKSKGPINFFSGKTHHADFFHFCGHRKNVVANGVAPERMMYFPLLSG